MSGKTHEIELKRMLLGEGAGDRLIASLGKGDARDARQTNHVFDTPDHALNLAHYVVRLRKEDASWFLTAKGPSRAVGASTSSKLEAEAEIEDEVAAELLAGKDDAVDELKQRARDAEFEPLWRGLDSTRGGRKLQVIGRFENLRRRLRVSLDDGTAIVLEIDRTEFPGGRVDEEVEIELPDDETASRVEAWLERAAERAGIQTAKSPPKTVRFYHAVEKAGGA